MQTLPPLPTYGMPSTNLLYIPPSAAVTCHDVFGYTFVVTHGWAGGQAAAHGCTFRSKLVRCTFCLTIRAECLLNDSGSRHLWLWVRDRYARDGERIASDGESAKGFFILIRGRVIVEKEREQGLLSVKKGAAGRRGNMLDFVADAPYPLAWQIRHAPRTLM